MQFHELGHERNLASYALCVCDRFDVSAAMIILKDIGVDPIPNHTRDVKKGLARWDAYINVPDPDALAKEFSSRNVEFFTSIKEIDDGDDGLHGFEIKDNDGYVLFFGCTKNK